MMKKAHCPTCGRDFAVEKSPAMPFCSVRCRDVDLGRWLEERNAIFCDSEMPVDAAAVEADERGPD